jgi:hypothetical protein
MNAPRLIFPLPAKGVATLAILAGSALLAGCIGNPFKDAKVDPASPVAADVTRLTRQAGDFPTFASIPAAPKPDRPVAQYGRDAGSVIASGDALVAATEPGTWTLKNTEGFAETARRQAGPQIEPPKPGDAEAFAKALRERATPPPPR